MSFKYDPVIAAKKENNRQVYLETMEICRKGEYSVGSQTIALPQISDVLSASVFYENPPKADSVTSMATTQIDAVNSDCIDVTRDLVEKGYRPIMLNMANRHTPGGGVLNGARAQEESLFRQSNLCVSLYQYSDYHANLLGIPSAKESYPMDRNTGGIYSGRVTFFRTSQRDGDKLVADPFECAVVSVAAINRPDLDANGRLVNWAIEATQKKIRTMLRIGLYHGHDAIVLGAWGCGAFCNPPEHMAEIFRDVLNESEFANKFKVVRFAVIEDHNSRHSNYAPFDKVFNNSLARPVSREDAAHLMVKRMKALAKKMHKRDTKPRKYTNAPYITHPAKVVDLLKSWGYWDDDMNDAVVLAIAWGHDLLEDTRVTLDELVQAADPQPNRIVGGIQHLTFDPSSGVDKDSYICGIAACESPERLVVKIADRLSNTLDFCEAGDVWAKEYLKLGEPLFARVDECKGADRIKAMLAMVREKVAKLQDPGFPKSLTADMLKDFTTTERGCTHPRVGTINGHKFIAKCGSWSAHSSDKHVHNEFVADNLLRAAGLNVPFSREYQVDFAEGLGPQTVRLAVYDDALRPIMEVWGKADDALKAKIREQTVAAYPVQALIAGIDTFTWDNVKVDPEGNLWFVDNGASFNYRACGKKKGWFWDREDIDDAATGYLSLAHHPHQGDLREVLGVTTDGELWSAAQNYKLRRLVRVLPDSHRRGALKKYAKAIDARSVESR